MNITLKTHVSEFEVLEYKYYKFATRFYCAVDKRVYQWLQHCKRLQELEVVD